MSSAQIVIDVREPDEFKVSHVTGAVNIPLGHLKSDAQIESLDRDTPIVTYCRSGSRAGVAQKILEQMGFSNVTNGINAEHVSRHIT